jgi:hypothetical protein
LNGKVYFSWPNRATYDGLCRMGKKHGRGELNVGCVFGMVLPNPLFTQNLAILAYRGAYMV